MDVSFESVCSLIYRLSHPPRSKSSSSLDPLPPSKIFQSWLNHLPRPLLPGTGKRLFRLLFPHEGPRRRYGLKETRLAVELERVLGVDGLRKWDGLAFEGEGGTGCLGKEVELIMKDRMTSERKSSMSLSELDTLLDELAASSPFSQLSIPPTESRPQSCILNMLYRDSSLSPYAAAVLTQIILRDLRPLLNPLPRLPIRNPTTLLRLKSNAGPAQLELMDAMRVWDPRMRELYISGVGRIDRCADLVETFGAREGTAAGARSGAGLGPSIGVNIPIPKCRKGRSVEDALSEFLGTRYAPPAREIWAETKHDGYRMQIHVDVANAGPVITIFSKSKRESTLDRLNTHSVILSALNLPDNPRLPSHPALSQRANTASKPKRRITRSIVLEAEVVPYNEACREGGRGPGIEEFWWLGVAGVTAGEDGAPGNAWRSRNRHLCLMWFDVLVVDGRSLLGEKYGVRRKVLKESVREIPGFSCIVERTRIPLSMGRHVALGALSEAFRQSNERRDEGLVLKANESTYARMSWRWVKLKGIALISSSLARAGTLTARASFEASHIAIVTAVNPSRAYAWTVVDTSVLTTFYLGVLANPDAVKSKQELPHYAILFRASYGPTRDQLEVYNENFRHGRWGSKPFDRDDPFKKRLIGLSWTYEIPQGMKPPSLLFERPMCAEVMGAGFQKLPGSELYELRWPRLQKIYDPRERSWTEALSAKDLIDTARSSLGYLPTSPRQQLGSPESDSLRRLWRTSSSFAVDIPDTPSPRTPSSNNRPLAKRVQSAPDIREILKSSPPTLVFHDGPSPGRIGTTEAMQTLLNLPTREAREARQAREGEVEEGVVWLRSPVTSPNRPCSRKRYLGAVEVGHGVTSSPKRIRLLAETMPPRSPVDRKGPSSARRFGIRTPPRSSPPPPQPPRTEARTAPLLPALSLLSALSLESAAKSKMIAHAAAREAQVDNGKKHKPTSLRSRMKVAAKRVGAVKG